jgi:hypothetical protein
MYVFIDVRSQSALTLAARMTVIAGTALITISMPALVITIGLRFRMLVTVDAFKGGVIRLIGMAVAAGVPAPRTMVGACGDRKIIIVRIKYRRLPRQRPVTRRTIDRKFGNAVIGILCGVVVFLMALGALDRRPAKSIVRMALGACDGLVCAPRRELCFIMIEIDQPRFRPVGMALQAIGAESRLAMIDHCRRSIVFLVTAIALLCRS